MKSSFCSTILILLICWLIFGCNNNKLSNQQLFIKKSKVIVISENEGEIYSPDRGGRTTMIKVSPKTGSQNISLMI